MANGIYLDNNTTTRPSDRALQKMLFCHDEMWGVPSQPHQMGQKVHHPMREAYQQIYGLLGASDRDALIFTSSGAEGVNQAFLSTYFDVTETTGKNQYITSNIEEAPALMSISRLEQLHCVGKMVDCDRMGQISPQSVAEAMTPRTALVSLSWANGLTGVIHPVAEIAAICHQRGVHLHLDATHILGKVFFDLSEIKPTFVTFNGDNIHAPKGTGGLLIREGTKCSAFITGGLEQAGYRAGNVNVPGLVALGAASQEAHETLDLLCTETARLRGLFEDELLKAIPESFIFFRDSERLPHCFAAAFPGVANELMLYALNKKGVYACIGGGSFQQIALVLTSAGISEQIAQTAISFALSRETTESEIMRAVSIISETYHRFKKLSTHVIS